MKSLTLLTLTCALLVITTLVLTTSSVMAVEPPTNIPEQAQTNRSQNRAESANAEEAQVQIQQNLQDRAPEQAQEQVQNALQQRTQARERVAAMHAMRLQRRFDFYYQRLTKITEKIETRLQLLVDQGVDVTSAQAGLNNAMMLLEEAMEKSNEAIAKFESIDPEDYQAQRAIALQARDEAQAARQAFQQALTELRQAVRLAMQAQEVGLQNAQQDAQPVETAE